MPKKVQPIVLTEEVVAEIRLELIPHVRMRAAIPVTDAHQLFPHIDPKHVNACIEMLHHNEEVVLGVNSQDNNSLWVMLGKNAWSLFPNS